MWLTPSALVRRGSRVTTHELLFFIRLNEVGFLADGNSRKINVARSVLCHCKPQYFKFDVHMGSYSELYVGRLLVASQKNAFMPEVVGLFQRDEFHAVGPGIHKVPVPLEEYYSELNHDAGSEEADNRRLHYYATTLSEISERLEYLGYSSENTRLAFYAWRDENVAWKREMAEEHARSSHEISRNLQEMYQREADELACLFMEDWVQAVKELIASGIRSDVSASSRRILELVGGDCELDYGPDYDFLISLRVMCDFTDPQEIVCYDVTSLVDIDFFEVGSDPFGVLVEHEFDNSSEVFRNSKTIVLVEGRSDIRILKAATESIFPRLADRFVFFDYEEFGIPGGAGNLVNLVKSFAAAGVANRIVALFDNDTGAEEALLALGRIDLPRNIKVIKLPDIDLLRAYPTIGPGGHAKMDITGLAAGIELYLGSDVLTRDDGTMREVRWTGYSKKLSNYQGEIVEKAEVQNLFLQKISESSVEDLRNDPEMRHIIEILQLVITAFSQELRHDILRHAKSTC